MNNYEIKLKLESPLITPLDADTIFGHICWALRFIKGKIFLEDFLGSYQKNPSFLVSDGFVDGYLPKPLLPDLNESELIDLFNDEQLLDAMGFGKVHNDKSSFIRFLTVLKKIKKIKIIPISVLKENCRSYTEKSVIKELIKIDFDAELAKDKDLKKSSTQEVMHNTIDRINGSTSGGGNLFSQDEVYYENNSVFVIFFKVFDKSIIPVLNEAFEYISLTGYGKDKSTGKGVFKMIGTISESEELDSIDSPDGNSILSLSSFIPNIQIKNISYDLKTKYGKQYMNTDAGVSTSFNPFKKPLIMMTSGSLLLIENNGKDEIIGSLINNVPGNPKVRSYAYLYPLRINIIFKAGFLNA